MASITLEYDARDIKAKKTIDFILSLGIFTSKQDKLNAVDISLSELKQGKVKTYKSVDEMLQKVLE